MRGYEVVPIAYHPDRKISIIHIDFSSEAKSTVGVLRDLTTIIAMHEIPIIEIRTSRTCVILFLDITGKNVEDIEKMKMKICNDVKYIEKLYVYESKVEGFAIDLSMYPPMLFNERVLILRESAFKSIVEGVIKSLKIAPQVVLYVIGREMGEKYYDRHVEVMGNESKRNIAKIAEYLFLAVGFGKPEEIKLDLERGEIEYDIYDCIECKINLEAGREMKSSLIRGMIEGYYTKLLGREVECIEEECVTQGNIKCKFKIKPIEVKI